MVELIQASSALRSSYLI